MNESKDIKFLNELSDYIFTSKYARYNEKKKRRETINEAVDRVLKMHLEKYSSLPEVDKERVRWAFQMVEELKVVPSMRSMQFGGKAVFAHQARMYNCSVRHIDSLRAFAESFYLLLCGCGVGFGLGKEMISRLPSLASAKDKTGSILTYTIEDNIEGWADSLEILLMSYFKNTPFTGRKIVFDYSKIRAKGTPLKTGGGKAPGPEGLKLAHSRIKDLLDHVIELEKLNYLKPIHAYDILMHSADAVVSGGHRRCLPEGYEVETKEGWKPIKELTSNDKVVFGKNEYSIKNVFDNGEQQLYKINTLEGYHESTGNHRWLVFDSVEKKIGWVETLNIKENPSRFFLLKEKK